MATARRTPVEPQDETPVSAGYDMGFTASDLTLPRMRVVGKDADLVTAGVAKPCDVAIGNSSDDELSTVYEAPGGVKFYVIDWRANYACGFNSPNKGSWEEGDPEMPADAKKQYHYTLFVPQFDMVLPVLYTANGSAAKIFRGVNQRLYKHCMTGHPCDVAFVLNTKMNTGNINGQNKSWPGPVIALGEAVESEVKIAKGLHTAIVGGGAKQLDAASDTPGF